ncbi:MAG: hypothetical protein ACRERV_02720 [Methylococcales bacterium]
MPAVYSFEAKAIQSYILDGSKLRDMVGASEQIENLCADNGLLDKVLEALEKQDTNFKQPGFSRRAGGAFTAFFDNMSDAENFQALWTYCVQQTLPGLDFVQGMAGDSDEKAAVKAVHEAKDADRNRFYARLPVPGPMVARYPRTGGASVQFSAPKKKAPKRTNGEALDEATVAKRYFRGKFLEGKINGFTSDFAKPKWPTFFPGIDTPEDEDEVQDNQFPLSADNRYIGVIHADANGLPCLPGRTVKGLLRDAVLRAETWKYVKAGTTVRWFGSRAFDSDAYSGELTSRLSTKPGALCVSDAVVDQAVSDYLLYLKNGGSSEIK